MKYRNLKVGEKIKEGDERSLGDGIWSRCKISIGCTITPNIGKVEFRRPIPEKKGKK